MDNKKKMFWKKVLRILIISVLLILITYIILVFATRKIRERTYENSAYEIINAARLYYMELKLIDKELPSGNVHDEIKIVGEKSKAGEIYINDAGYISIAIEYEKKCYYKSFDTEKITIFSIKEKACTTR